MSGPRRTLGGRRTWLLVVALLLGPLGLTGCGIGPVDDSGKAYMRALASGDGNAVCGKMTRIAQAELAAEFRQKDCARGVNELLKPLSAEAAVMLNGQAPSSNWPCAVPARPETLAPYKRVRVIEFALPKTISGKIRRVELREHAASGLGEEHREER